MKRYGKSEHLWERICSLENVELAMKSALVKHKYRGQITSEYSAEQQYVIDHWNECRDFIMESLSSETYKFSPLRTMTITDRKRRTLHFPILYPDKIYCRCAYQVLRPYFYSKYTDNTYNCIKGRGILKAKQAIENIFKQHPDWYYVSTDIKSYYDSIDHHIMKQSVRNVFKCNKVIRFLDCCIDSYSSVPNVGLAIGINLTQLFAILYRSELMHAINEQWHCPAVEFTDDLLAVFKTKEECHLFLTWYIDYCSNKLKLKVKPSACIAPIGEPLRILGYDFRINDAGEQYTLLRRNIKDQMKRQVKRFKKMNLTDDEWKQQMASYYGWCKHANCVNLMRTVFGEHYKLFENIDMEKLQRLSEKKQELPTEFGLTSKAWVSITILIGKDIVLLDGHYSKRYKEERFDRQTNQLVSKAKYVIKFRYVDEEEEHYTISTSDSLADRVERAKSLFPCIAKIVIKRTQDGHSYYVIE